MWGIILIVCVVGYIFIRVGLNVYVQEKVDGDKSTFAEQKAETKTKLEEGKVLVSKDTVLVATYSAYIITDTETGIQYIVVSSGAGMSITPRLSSNNSYYVKVD